MGEKYFNLLSVNHMFILFIFLTLKLKLNCNKLGIGQICFEILALIYLSPMNAGEGGK